MKPIIQVRGLSKRYRIGAQRARYGSLRESLTTWARQPFPALGRKRGLRQPTIWALKDVTFDVMPGEVLGVIGRNGAGKSTLLKVLSRITEPTEGEVDLFGRVGSLLEVGTGFHPELTGRENIFLNGAVLGMTRVEIIRKFDEIVAFAEIERFVDTPVKHYSSGMFVRLAFSVAAHLEPEILLVDEVLAVGDYEFQKKCLGKMQQVSQSNRTVMFVSHNLGSVSNLCSRVVWLDEGRLVSEGAADEVISQYVRRRRDESGALSWPDIATAPGNENVRIRSVTVLSEGAATTEVPIDRPITIEMEYWNLKDGNVLVCGFEIRDKANNYVLASHDRRSANASPDGWFGRPRPKGLYRTRCVIPANFLNNLHYTVDIGVAGKHNQWEARVTDRLDFAVYETGEMTKEYSGPWLGAVRPRLSWTTELLGDKVDQAER
jgi:lipopolysaccharide transport system ATP-binding protein